MRFHRLVGVVVLTYVAQACSSSPAETTTINVFAAASLTESFERIASSFENKNPELNINFNFASASELARMIIDGAPADLFASSDNKNMQKVVTTDLVDGRISLFATNSLQIMVEFGNPRGIHKLSDLNQPGLLFVTCAQEVPIGHYTAQVLAKAGIELTPSSLEENVRGIVSKVTSGEADAGIVYHSDIVAAGKRATGIDIPADVNVTAQYLIAVLDSSKVKNAAGKFLHFVLSDTGQSLLAEQGFGAP